MDLLRKFVLENGVEDGKDEWLRVLVCSGIRTVIYEYINTFLKRFVRDASSLSFSA